MKSCYRDDPFVYVYGVLSSACILGLGLMRNSGDDGVVACGKVAGTIAAVRPQHCTNCFYVFVIAFVLYGTQFRYSLRHHCHRCCTPGASGRMDCVLYAFLKPLILIFYPESWVRVDSGILFR
ncbi:hypothetical protein BO99DRAFT_143957 [Aspergillus violaceofuscus CBS 115571]|uniref:Uncharacterized protein n=1 Tax=Aspergillus violaceofuscus (strain CBS 115571) TaxID=1450538 RepID=A0A2V5HD72_ASPV1|nr:hypothetical protein BO99DRAFT_143957 [Aspergillus violaceofuscus CBS 115571]